MKFYSLLLVSKEIKRLTDLAATRELEEHEKIMLSQYNREYMVLSKLKVECFDITGSYEELAKRLENNSVVLMPKNEYENIEFVTHFFNRVRGEVHAYDKLTEDL